jgi:thiazole synthase ThiGH ThiG subunit
MVTVAVNRVPLDRKTESFLDTLTEDAESSRTPAGCYDADHAIRTGSLAREALETDWVKLEVIGDHNHASSRQRTNPRSGAGSGKRGIHRPAVLLPTT